MSGEILELRTEDLLKAAAEILSLAPDVRVVVVLAESETFSDGQDTFLNDLTAAVERSRVPVILSVSGTGAVPARFVAAFHLCFASDDISILRDNEVLPAPDAVDSGLVNAAFSDGFEVEKARETAEAIAGLSQSAVRSCLASVRNGSKGSLEEGLAGELRLFSELFETSDMKEGTCAFLEKRTPKFKGE